MPSRLSARRRRRSHQTVRLAAGLLETPVMLANSARRSSTHPARSKLSLVPAKGEKGRPGLIAAGGLLLLLVGAILMRELRSGTVTAPRSAAVATAVVTEGSVIGWLRVRGGLDRESTVRVGSTLSGQVVAVTAQPGDAVTRAARRAGGRRAPEPTGGVR
ncbi:MAG TPA: hypothetical protein VHU40_07485 [Polyangia bacterium]|jgi:hypothetical protein|nr:hypothetical protein [Polyangia bacterium]